MTFPSETISLGPGRAGLNVAAVFNRPDTGQAWNGTAWMSNTQANLVLGAVTTTADANGNAFIAIPSGIGVQFVMTAYQFTGSFGTGQMIQANYLGYGGNGAVTLNKSQIFNNTGQTSPLPGFQSGGNSFVVSSNGSVSTTYTGATIFGAVNYPFNFTWIYPIDLTGWTQIVFTAKAQETDADSAAVVTVKLSSPGSGSDGLTILNGAAPSGSTTAADGALAVSIANGQTTIQLALTARGMGLTSAASLFWEITAYNSAGAKLPVVDGGTFSVDPSVRANPVVT